VFLGPAPLASVRLHSSTGQVQVNSTFGKGMSIVSGGDIAIDTIASITINPFTSIIDNIDDINVAALGSASVEVRGGFGAMNVHLSTESTGQLHLIDNAAMVGLDLTLRAGAGGKVWLNALRMGSGNAT